MFLLLIPVVFQALSNRSHSRSMLIFDYRIFFQVKNQARDMWCVTRKFQHGVHLLGFAGLSK